MAKEPGYSNYICDRSISHQAYLKDGSASANSWRDIKRYTQDGVEQAWFLCADCAKAYKLLAAKQDTEFNQFMEEGGQQ